MSSKHFLDTLVLKKLINSTHYDPVCFYPLYVSIDRSNSCKTSKLEYTLFSFFSLVLIKATVS